MKKINLDAYKNINLHEMEIKLAHIINNNIPILKVTDKEKTELTEFFKEHDSFLLKNENIQYEQLPNILYSKISSVFTHDTESTTFSVKDIFYNTNCELPSYSISVNLTKPNINPSQSISEKNNPYFSSEQILEKFRTQLNIQEIITGIKIKPK